MTRWRRIHAAPHRLAFTLGSINLVLVALWWGLAFGGWLHTATPALVPLTAWHGLLFGGAFMPLFIAGFLFTTLPRWLHVRPSPMRSLVWPLWGLAAGWWGVMLASARGPWLAAAGLGVVLAAWLHLAWLQGEAMRQSRATDRLHACLILIAWLVGALGVSLVLADCLGLTTPTGMGSSAPGSAWRAGTALLLWGCLAPVFLTALHRMVSYLSMSPWPRLDARHPAWLLALVLPALWLHAAFAAWGHGWGGLSGQVPSTHDLPLKPARDLAALMAGGALMVIALRWPRVQNLRQRMLAMLALGCFWMGLALVATVLGNPHPAHHALALGAMGSLMLAMVTRVSCTHGGQPVVADRWLWWSFLALQPVVALRLLASLVSGPHVGFTLSVALWGWGLLMALWASRLIRWSWKT